MPGTLTGHAECNASVVLVDEQQLAHPCLTCSRLFLSSGLLQSQTRASCTDFTRGQQIKWLGILLYAPVDAFFNFLEERRDRAVPSHLLVPHKAGQQ